MCKQALAAFALICAVSFLKTDRARAYLEEYPSFVTKCSTYITIAADTPPEMMRFLAANPGAGMYVCIGPPTPSGPTPPAYFELSPAQWTMGVCRFETAGLVHASLRGTAEWTRTTQNLGKQYMQRGRSSQVCPPQNDRGYINAVGLSVEDFAALDDFWRGLGGSPAKFAAATSQINPQALIREDYARFRNLVETSPQSLRADIYQKLPGEFYEADLIGRAYLYDLRLQRAPAGFLITDFRARIPF